ncbi:MAG: hypothetical protein Q7N50_01195, partial [Armatimonadota bacterium]|nr:hypothetical protein [Armatimonadota bacterium]
MAKLNRRQLLQAGLVGAGALVFNEGLASVGGQNLKMGGRQVSRTSGRARDRLVSTCLNCFA